MVLADAAEEAETRVGQNGLRNQLLFFKKKNGKQIITTPIS